MQILDRVFDCYNVVVLFLVNDVDDRGLRRALTGAGWSRHKHQAVSKLGNLFELFR
jgi:hypothetical protein